MLRGVAVVTSAGNEGQARHHYSGQVSQNACKVEVKVGESEYGFTMELWGISTKPILCGYRITIWTENRKDSRRVKRAKICNIFIGKTRLIVEYFTVDTSAGAPVIVMRFQNPAPGFGTSMSVTME